MTSPSSISNDTARATAASFGQDFLGSAATQFPELVTIIDTSISVLCNALFIIAIIYAFAAISLVIWPQSLVKVPPLPPPSYAIGRGQLSPFGPSVYT